MDGPKNTRGTKPDKISSNTKNFQTTASSQSEGVVSPHPGFPFHGVINIIAFVILVLSRKRDTLFNISLENCLCPHCSSCGPPAVNDFVVSHSTSAVNTHSLPNRITLPLRNWVLSQLRQTPTAFSKSRTMAKNKTKADGMRSTKSTSSAVQQSASATEASRFLFKTATAPPAATAPATTPRNPFVLPSAAPTNGPKSTSTITTTEEQKRKKPVSKEEYLEEAQRRHNASQARRDAELRKLYRTCPSTKRAVKRYARRREQWAKSMRKLQKAGAFLENMGTGALGGVQIASKPLQKTSPDGSAKVTPEPSLAKSSALPQTNFSVGDHRENDSRASSITSSSDETVKSDTRTVDSLSTNITTPDLSDCDSLVKSATKSPKQKTASSTAAVAPTEQPASKSEKFKITVNVESVQKSTKDAAPTTTSSALTPKKSVDGEKAEKKQKKESSDKADGQELQKEKKKEKKAKAADDAQPAPEKKSKKHKRDEHDKEEGGATEQEQPKAKKPKTSEPPAMTSAVSSGIDRSYKPYPNVPPEIRKELFIRKAEEMLNNPMGYDDLVYDDTRPKSKRPKWKKVGRNTGPSDMMMSGGIGPADGSSSSTKAKKNRAGGDDSLSKQVLKKGHNNKVAEEVASLKQQKSSEFKKNKHIGGQNGQQGGGGGQKNWKHKPNLSTSLAHKFNRKNKLSS